MTLPDQPHFTSLMTSIAELYNKKLSKPLLDIYWRCLESYSISIIRTALNAHVLHPDYGQFMPKPADILRMIEGNSETKALQAWSKVLKAIRTLGSYQSVVFNDCLIHAAIMDLDGWVNLCLNDTKTLFFISKQFERIYCGYLQRKPVRYPRQLTGQFIQRNISADFSQSRLSYIGNPRQAKAVWDNGCDPIEYSRQYTEEPAILSLNAGVNLSAISAALSKFSGESRHEN